MKTIDIKGKAYVTVNERVKYFTEKYVPLGWGSHTEIFLFNSEEVVMRTDVIDPDNRIRGTGWAQESKNASNINKTSYVENCQTSSLGRALGIALGIGIDEAIATADEVERANEKLAYMNEPINGIRVKALTERCENTDTDIPSLLSFYGRSNIEELTNSQFEDAMTRLEKKPSKLNY